MLYIESPQQLTVMLAMAANAHHEYETATGKPDADWQTWYARYMFQRYAPGARPLAVNSEPLTLGDL